MKPFTRAAYGRRRRRWPLRQIAALTGLALIPSLLTAPAWADDVDPIGRPELQAPRADKVSPFQAKIYKRTAETVQRAAAADRRAIERAAEDRNKTVTWPSTATTTLKLPPKGAVKAAPGGLPVTLTRSGKAGKAAESVTVTVLDQKRAAELGVKGLVLSVTGPAQGGTSGLALDYSAFASAYGGDWAGRLQLTQLPGCALSAPASAACRTRTPLRFTNDRRSEQLKTDLAFRAAPARAARATSAPAATQTMVLAVAAGTKSGSGDYKATPLAASSTWEAGGSSGTFTWSYPLRVPPSAAGPKPDLKISYDSGSIDGRTASTNNQGTAIGEGFDIPSSYIERRYGSCDDDGQDDKNDLCWKYENASLVLNGHATELVKDDVSGQWRLKNDDASTVLHHSDAKGADNGDDNREYWTVITGDGTKYHFGLNKLPGATTQATQSVWTVPVFGDDEGEPGYTQSGSFSGRAEKQAWRWNLDYVEDTHKNAMSYWYAAEHNHYDMLGDDNTGTPYVRGGILKEIRYGQRADALFASPAGSNRVLFDYAERCVASGTGCDSLTEDTRDNWPDVPFDAECKADLKCTGSTGPAFYTRKRMTGITTEAWNAAAATPAYEPVDSWSLKQTYLDPGDTGDSTDQSLWLDEIRQTGRRGTAITLPPVTFAHEFRANRVDGASDDILPLNKPRLYTITSETGARTIVNYQQADCLASQAKPKVDTNTRRCYPVYWSPNGAEEPTLDWFHKYPVSSVTTSDRLGSSPPVEHTYTYEGGGAWHYNDDPMVPTEERTWSTWRGFGKVTHHTGVVGKTRSKTVTVYLRGMNGDRVLGPDGKTPHPTERKTATVTGIAAPALTDSAQYAGFTRETVTYSSDTEEVSGQVNDPWSKRTATQHESYADTEAHFVRTAATHGRTRITTSQPARDRVRTVETLYDAYGMAYQVHDKGDNGIQTDDTCTRTWYARNNTVGINKLVTRTRVTAGACVPDDQLDLPADSSRPGDVVSDTATAYDSTTWSATQSPTKGQAQWTGRARGYGIDDQPVWQKTATMTYDDLGRVLIAKDTNDTATATTVYTPAATGPLTATKVTNAKGHSTDTLLDFATGAATKVTDANRRSTYTEYDALGRVTKVWLPNRSKLENWSPNYTYAYNITNSGETLPWVSTSTIRGDIGDAYNTTYEIYDSLLRLRQVQKPTPVGGRIIDETFYDERGLAVTTSTDIWNKDNEPSGGLVATEGGQTPIQVDVTYDGAGRATKSVTKVRGAPRWTVETAYTGDTVTTTAPAGGQATKAITNALGQTTERREYGGPQPEGSDYTTTTYAYLPGGRQATVTGPDQAKWRYSYDLFGRQTSTTDPDKGTGTTVYNELNQAVSVTDSRGKTLVTEYDILGRKTGLWDGSKTDATKLAAWTYDTLAKGQQDTAVRYENGVNQTTSRAYTQKVTGYNPLYQPTGSQLILPDGDPLVAAGVPKTLSASTKYDQDGTVSSMALPAVAGLPAETVEVTRNNLGQEVKVASTTAYLLGAAYSPQGDVSQLTLGTGSGGGVNRAYLTYGYEEGTRRLTHSYVSDNVHAYYAQDLRYTQDPAGNVTSLFDVTTQGGASKADYQCFAYDGHRRLTEAWTPRTADCATTGRTTANIDGAAPYWHSYTYNAAGQRATETEHTATGDKATTYTYGTTAGQPHPLAKTTGVRNATYAYDKAGNTTSRPGTQAQQTLTWNSEGKLVGTTEPAAGIKPALGTSYLYDASGELLIRRATGDGDTILYLGSMEVRLTTKGTTKTLSGTRYYTAAGKTIAVRTATAGTTDNKLNYLASDHHGTSTVALDATTMAITRRYTTPFGAQRGPAVPTWPDDKSFLGKPEDKTTGLTHIGAREYDPSLGLFISVDPLLQLDLHQTLNGYTYGAQNPVANADPSGLGLTCGRGFDEACGKGVVTHADGSTGKNGEPNKTPKPSGDGGGSTSGGTSGTSPSGGGGGGGGDGGDDCGFWSMCTLETAWEDTKNWVSENKAEIAAVATEIVVGTACVGAAIGAGVATGGAGLVAVAGCGALAGAAGAGVRNALTETADHSVKGQLADMSEGALWGAAGAVLGAGAGAVLGKAANQLAAKSMAKCHSFLPGTGVLLADGSRKAIEDVEVGDVVVTTDTETGETVTKRVTETITTEDDKDFTEITVLTKDGHSSIVATDTHPFWVPELRKWVPAGDLRLGQTLRTSAGTHVQITALSYHTKRQRTHDLTIQDVHAYYVLAGATPVLVHNCNSGANGGKYGDLQPAGAGNEINHVPANSSSPLSKYSGPSIRMEYDDHRAVYSTGSYIESQAWRMRQKELIDAGDFRGAIQMDVDDIRARFGSKYDEAIVEMWMSLSSNKALRKWAAERSQ
ncbi:polymorphic toxin-type HINT domain-containing protein [Streptomyces roseolilacinus]|uniref:polymorphic toxin-type HINT domain-containing protein n=1 Tax=Streptomyces roseolilacinus TaxID=66904 RepID=UPI003803456A